MLFSQYAVMCTLFVVVKGDKYFKGKHFVIIFFMKLRL